MGVRQLALALRGWAVNRCARLASDLPAHQLPAASRRLQRDRLRDGIDRQAGDAAPVAGRQCHRSTRQRTAQQILSVRSMGMAASTSMWRPIITYRITIL